MTMYYDVITFYDEKYTYYQIPRVWLLDFTPSIITQISNNSFFDLEDAYLRFEPDGALFENYLSDPPYVEVVEREDIFHSKFTEHCLAHKIPFSLSGFMAYDWSFYVNYRFRCHKWLIRTNKRPKPIGGFKFYF